MSSSSQGEDCPIYYICCALVPGFILYLYYHYLSCSRGVFLIQLQTRVLIMVIAVLQIVEMTNKKGIVVMVISAAVPVGQ